MNIPNHSQHTRKHIARAPPLPEPLVSAAPGFSLATPFGPSLLAYFSVTLGMLHVSPPHGLCLSISPPTCLHHRPTSSNEVVQH